MTRKIGAHQSIAGGYHMAMQRIAQKGGNTLQIFSSSPRSWSFASVDEPTIQQFIIEKNKLQITPVYFHASYLINLANNGQVGRLSKKSLINELCLAAKMGIKGSVVHLGSFKEDVNQEKYQILISNIKEVLKQTPKQTLFIIENAGNRKIGQTIEEIGRIVHDVNEPQVMVCLDTCHLHAAGYNLSTKLKLDHFLAEFDHKVGLDKLELWHVNDSKDEFGALRDRHENIGQGKIGLESFRILINHPQTKNLPFIIETPGFDNQGPDKQNIDILKSLANNK
ncbi:hypothetical protein A3F03_02230 [Candidatus Roizmanbacteria bacterium RIFCSPHIGHO2_12_FULL_41_11]|uniref:Probable endonuclease 4 n=3 Tax=Candidatus Roizmaniibacteriota TaxID=1752723 RepID=A0A1F7JRL9_9BACT|nr:MAG: hypothetical protein A3F03_02230 [Candidatus Roizmanbacteria bacterium RIFCSPHIGHO2_12_FULL_41_11]OGK51873.1 MAG: hypothetical protein A2966_00650 [Candidatus Roizmanbacteria bacterium RIFCSPLOWO2_01_FULL_41_22]OGK58242.1 MAG: hypothetical protein A3H86_02575 [Candidatus Roizmanbacteria bacterium RIFCSPLOWO2_02_FULL_41_9]